MAFAENLRRLRLEQFLSQGELARRASLHAVTLTRLEGGATAPSTRTVRALAEALGVEPRELATPDEVAELRRFMRDDAQIESDVRYQQDAWNDDGGAVQTPTSGRAE
ncbi:MAG: helix-turn-helix transcriptional regulator [Chloroflexi bacterium]|nr:helix-turn-helix transcriptional regulator [Chloroflexota bacterium]